MPQLSPVTDSTRNNLGNDLTATGNIIKGIGALLGLVPLLAVIYEVVAIPHDLESMAKLISFFVTVAGILSIMLNRNWISSLRSNKAALLVTGLVLFGSTSAIGYWTFARSNLVTIVHPKSAQAEEWKEQVFIPLRPSPEIRDMVAPFGNDYILALATGNHREKLSNAMRREQTSAMMVTLLLMVLANILLVLGIVGGAWKLATRPPIQFDSQSTKVNRHPSAVSKNGGPRLWSHRQAPSSRASISGSSAMPAHPQAGYRTRGGRGQG
jgi:hypothetical protein